VSCLLTLVGCSDSTDDGNGGPPPPVELAVEVVASGLDHPLYLTAPAGDPRLFVVEQPGRVRIVDQGQLLATPFLDITDIVSDGGERGLLSIAFHPRYSENGYFYASYTDNAGDTRIDRFSVSSDPNLADRGSGKLILAVDQPYANHNGGLILFGPGGKLYVGLGDGGSAGDPHGHGQNRGTLLGSLLRIDVDAGDPYAIPSDNSFVGVAGARGEIWAYGLRNPWRFAFDEVAGLIYIGDVGQNRWEEIDVAAANAAGLNYGWNIMEGKHCYASDTCDSAGLTLPLLEYDHGDGCSVIGGYVYRGAAIPELGGLYFYSDYCTGFLRSFNYSGGTLSDARQWAVGALGDVLSFGEDAARELYILSGNGRVYRLIARR
jgi:glucose/arabinose dehydrogenase